ncbi:hypothetical protein F4779DRAFT_261301 [Xylariaceae sp. FL0662B]|nr:hypothetical protein F4779DRAFT_261301 [Xylariaceae sp. FL0662B]
MLYKQFITAVSAIAWGASTTAAMSHGEFADHAGLVVRYHQLARDVFTGVPAEEWDDSIHQRSDEEWDINPLATRGNYEVIEELEGRNLKGVCQLIFQCFKEIGKATVSAGYAAWLETARTAADKAGKPLMKFLNQPFWANAGGVAIAGIVSGQINLASSCSTASSDADVLASAIAAAVAAHPNSSEVSVTVNGKGGTWTVTVAAGAKNKDPTPTCEK